ncbi:gamma-aminobutyric acid type B receptor subunit 2 isoform X2 [Exaiptasia diaphana]|uniref:Gamma-aminobutyric acid type B receptor subunit 2 n=1 Tax=Exaiptasia diaphana TaxID=2652724 RepID=A0A913WR88_EXADI|nr:gamma-aminobutyric acid type B receptor subunit 2 isoform X2 [Exaiptasia diaphana]
MALQCNIGESVRALVEYISNGRPKLMLLGPGCSKASFPVAEAAHYWNILQIGFASASPLFSQKSTYPLYFRTNPSEHPANLGRVSIIKRFNWKKVAILQMNNDVFTGITDSLASLLKQNNISIVAYESFSQHPRIAIENLKKKDARIIFGFFYIRELYMVFCEAFKQGLYGRKYVWIVVSGRYEGKWWHAQDVSNINCTSHEVRQGMSNILGTGEIKLSTSKQPTVSGQIPSMWYSRYLNRTKEARYGVNIFASYGYDAAWTCALALNASIEILSKAGLRLEDFNYTNTNMRKVFVDVMKQTSFMGMTGHVRFDENFDRITQLEIKQLQGDEEKRVALYHMESNKYIDEANTKYQWIGGHIPVDSLSVSTKERTVPDWLFWLVASFSLAGIVLAVAMLVFNIHNKKIRYIKMSSPNLNNALIVGCIFIYVGGLINGYYGNWFSIFCEIELWIITLGFTLAFGAMFSKTWRVHQIFLGSKKSNKRVIIPDRQLFCLLGFLLLIDLIILLTWQIMDPLIETKQEMSMEVFGDEAVLPYVRKCNCQHMVIWKSILLVYKGLLLLFGAYLAWETRKVHIEALNDSKLIGMCIYNAVVLFTAVVPVQSVLESEPMISFALLNGLTILSTTFTICVVFIPKIIFLRKNDGNDIQACTGNSSKEEKYSCEVSRGTSAVEISQGEKVTSDTTIEL